MIPDSASACPIKNPIGPKKSVSMQFELYDSRIEPQENEMKSFLLAVVILALGHASAQVRVFTPPPDVDLAYVDLQGIHKTIASVPYSAFAPRVSPNGKQLTIDLSQGTDSAVYLIDLPGPSTMRRFTMQGENHYPIWSPDGLRLLFISVRNGQPAIYSQALTGSGDAERLTETARAPESYSAVNQMLSYITLNTNGGNADYDVWTYSFRDKKSAPLIQIKNSAQHSSRFSPDGKWIAYVSDESGRLETYVQPYPLTGTKIQITKKGGGHPLWSPDEKVLYFDNDGRLFKVAIQTSPKFTAGDPVETPIYGFIQGPGNNRRQYDMIPDGKQFVMMFEKQAGNGR
jgi:Tol biopolymer transport system component